MAKHMQLQRVRILLACMSLLRGFVLAFSDARAFSGRTCPPPPDLTTAVYRQCIKVTCLADIIYLSIKAAGALTTGGGIRTGRPLTLRLTVA